MAKQKITYEPQILDLVLYGGDGVGFRLIVTDSDEEPMDLTGVTRAYIRLTRNDYELPTVEFAVDDGIVILSLTGEQTTSLVEGLDAGVKFIGVWDVEWTGTDAEPLTLCQGKLECMPDVTH
jgi:hypothetical protein